MRDGLALAGGVLVAAAATIAGMAAGFWLAVIALDWIPGQFLGNWFVLLYPVVIMVAAGGGAIGLFVGYQVHFWLRRRTAAASRLPHCRE